MNNATTLSRKFDNQKPKTINPKKTSLMPNQPIRDAYYEPIDKTSSDNV